MSTTAITGATGYIGRHLVARLVAQGVRPRCLVRAASRPGTLPVEKVEVVHGEIGEPETLAALMAGADSVVHLASIVANLKQTDSVGYARVNAEGTARVVTAAQQAHVRHLIYMGGLNTVPGRPGSYIRTRFDAEQSVRTCGVPYTILQPSILFGDGSPFFTTLAHLARKAPVVPVPGSGAMKFQPIWVEDVVTCITLLLKAGGRDETVPIGGPAHYTYDRLLDLIFQALHVRRLKLHVPLPLLKLGAAAMQSLLPRPPVTTATLELFETESDNITALDAVASRFGFQPRSLEVELRERGI